MLEEASEWVDKLRDLPGMGAMGGLFAGKPDVKGMRAKMAQMQKQLDQMQKRLEEVLREANFTKKEINKLISFSSRK